MFRCSACHTHPGSVGSAEIHERTSGHEVFEIDTLGLSEHEQSLVWGALLGQIEDNHAGGVFGWTEHDHEVAAALFERLEDQPEAFAMSEVQRMTILLSLLFPVHDMDHPAMSDEQVAAGEKILAEFTVLVDSRADQPV